MLLMALICTFVWMSQVDAGAEQNPDVPFAVSITGPASANHGDSATYTITYSDVPETGGVNYTPPSDFTVTSTSPISDSTSGNTLVWLYSTTGSSGTITINGQYDSASCTAGDKSHQAQVYDTHPSGVTVTDVYTTTVVCSNPTLGAINGTVFNDTNGNRVQNAGESGISGVTITLDGTTTTTTGSDGSYSFTDVPAGSHTVVETNLAGFGDTTLNSRTINLLGGGDVTVNFGDIQQGTISGTVVDNATGNGIAGVSIRLLQNGSQTGSTTTNSTGSYSFSDVPTDVYVVEEVDPSGYTSVSSNRVTVNLNDESSATANFTDQLVGTISGIVFDDHHPDGTQEDAEAGIEGVTVTLSDNRTTTTDASGYYQFDNVPASDTAYDVTISTPTDRTETTENPVSVPVTNESPSSSADFGLADLPEEGTGDIAGQACFDQDGDASCDRFESGVTIVVSVIPIDGRSPDGGQMQSETDSEGNYLFENVPIGSYRVEAQVSGDDTIPTTALEVPVSISDQQTASVDFGLASQTAVSGVVFADTDGNGEQSELETGVAGIQVALMSGGTEVASTTSNTNGQYQFDEIDGNNSYNAVITVPAGLVATTATDQSIAPGNSANFGLSSAGTLSGVVYRDQNGNGKLDKTEIGLNGATIELNNGMSAVSNGNGVYEFEGLAAGEYTVTESDPPGFISTDNSKTATIPENGSAFANFGDRRAHRVGGRVFNDLNGNGSKDKGEAGFGGTKVELRDADNTVIATKNSLPSGGYEFLNVSNGQYSVVMTTPTGFQATTPAEVDATVTDSNSPIVNFGLQQERVPTALSQPSLNHATPTRQPFWLALLLLGTVAGLAFYRTRASR